MALLVVLNGGILLPMYIAGNTNDLYDTDNCFNGTPALTNIQ